VTEGHVYVAASGFGLRVVPVRPPYRFRLSAIPSELDVERSDSGSWLFARVIPHEGGYRSRIAEHTPSLAAVLDVLSGPQSNEWWLDTSVYRVPLPVGWTAFSATGPCLFDLVSSNGAVIFIQTPARVPELSAMCAPGQRVVATGGDGASDWIDLRYIHEGIEWHQRHRVRRCGTTDIVVTAQAPAEAMAGTADTQQELVRAVIVKGS
jgi:hypothetical protein